jgi:hypothetical protein
MFKTLKKFDDKAHEVVQAYNSLQARKVQLEEELTDLTLSNSHFSPVDLLNGNYKTESNGKRIELKEEIAAIDSFIENVRRLSIAKKTDENSIVCRSDKELEAIGKKIVEEVNQQLSEVEKKRLNLDKRIENLIGEITSVCKDAEEFGKEKQQIEDVIAKVKRRTHLEPKTLGTAHQLQNMFAFSNFVTIKNHYLKK